MKKKFIFLIFLALLFGGLFLVQTFADAVIFRNPFGTGDFNEMLRGILSWLWPLSGTIAVLMIMVGAYHLVLSGGNPEKIITGKKIIISALIGFAVITMATGIIALVRRILGLDGGV